MNSTTPRENRSWPAYILGGRLRTTTVAMIIAFCAIWWVYETYEPPTEPHQLPASEVVPPGFIPDPAYTWAPRTDVQRRTPVTTTTVPPTPTTTSTTPTSPTTASSATPTSEPTETGVSTTGPSPTPSSPAPTPGTSAPAPAPSATESVAPAASERPLSPTPTPAAGRGGAESTPVSPPR